MSFVTDLMARGVTRTGAIQTLLGRPISLSADRRILSQLALPAAFESLSQPLTSSTVIRPVDRRITQLVSAVSGTPMPVALNTSSLTVTPTSTTTSSTQQAKLNAIQTSIRNIELAIQKLTMELLKLTVRPPGMPLEAWQAQLRTLRAMLRNLRNVLAMLMQQYADLTGTTYGERTSDYTGSGAQNQAEFEALMDPDPVKQPSGSTGTRMA